MRRKSFADNRLQFFLVLFVIFLFSLFYFSCASAATSAEEYYLIGMAYYELGKFSEAEKWLNRAKQSNRTMVASTYNLGRLAFEDERYEEAAKHFEDILKKDSVNVLALKAAAYSRIKLGEIEKAEKHYARLLVLVPESADDGYNHALVLYAMKRFEDAETVLEKFPFSLKENKDVMLLYARSQKAQNKIEAVNSYSACLNISPDNKTRFEYAQVLEYHELYARSLEEYRKTLSDTTSSSVDPKRNEVRFGIARVLLTAESQSNQGITELEGAVSDGFDNIAAVEELLSKRTISAANINSIRNIVNNMRSAAAKSTSGETSGDTEEETEE